MRELRRVRAQWEISLRERELVWVCEGYHHAYSSEITGQSWMSWSEMPGLYGGTSERVPCSLQASMGLWRRRLATGVKADAPNVTQGRSRCDPGR